MTPGSASDGPGRAAPDGRGLAVALAWALLLASAALIFARAPRLLLEPRFWAEEGRLFFAYAYAHPWWAAIFHPSAGYMSLVPQAATAIAARCVPLEAAPAVTTVAAFLVQLAPVALILASRCDLWRSVPRKALGVAIVLFAPLSNEIWLTTTSSQFFLAAATFLVVLDDAEGSPVVRWLRRVVLVVGGLTGVASCLLAPVFLFRALRERGRERWIQSALLLACLAVQVACLAPWMQRAAGWGSRFASVDAGIGLAATIVWTRSIGLAFLGLDATSWLAQRLDPGRSPGAFTAAGVALIAVDGLVLWALARSLDRTRAVTLVGSYLLSVLAPIRFAVQSGPRYRLVFPEHSPRYFFVANVVLLVTLAANLDAAGAARSRLRSRLVGALLAIALLHGAASYFFHLRPVDDAWPSWRAEVAEWRRDPRHPIGLWPRGWELRLRRRLL